MATFALSVLLSLFLAVAINSVVDVICGEDHA
jgi:hypothetical protein